MRHHSVIYLIRITMGEDEIGNPTEKKDERMVYANEMSVSMNEFYEAGRSGIRAEKQFEIYSFEYDDEPYLKHEGIEYKVIRTPKRGDKIRIVCERRGVDNED